MTDFSLVAELNEYKGGAMDYNVKLLKKLDDTTVMIDGVKYQKIEEPSKPMPSSKAFSNSAGAIATDLRVPRMSVNQSLIKRISRSSIVRSTNSCCLLIFSLCGDMSASCQIEVTAVLQN